MIGSDAGKDGVLMHAVFIHPHPVCGAVTQRAAAIPARIRKRRRYHSVQAIITP